MGAAAAMEESCDQEVVERASEVVESAPHPRGPLRPPAGVPFRLPSWSSSSVALGRLPATAAGAAEEEPTRWWAAASAAAAAAIQGGHTPMPTLLRPLTILVVLHPAWLIPPPPPLGRSRTGRVETRDAGEDGEASAVPEEDGVGTSNTKAFKSSNSCRRHQA